MWDLTLLVPIKLYLIYGENPTGWATPWKVLNRQQRLSDRAPKKYGDATV